MDVLVAGSSGLIGTALVDSLRRDGARVRRLVRHPPAAPDEFRWDPERATIDVRALDGVDGVVNLAGAGVGDHRWTRAYRATILRSRLATTGLLASTLAGMADPPRVWIQASAIGYYGDRGAEPLTEDSGPGRTFLSGVVRRWEAATAPAQDAVRVASIRSGIVLTGEGGALGRLAPILRSGLGGRLGPGTQYWSWITIDDEVAAIKYLLRAPVAGPVNLTAPHPVTNAQFTAAFAAALHRPARLPVPAPALRVALGGFAQDLLSSARVLPRALAGSGFTFRHPTVQAAASAVLGEHPRPTS